MSIDPERQQNEFDALLAAYHEAISAGSQPPAINLLPADLAKRLRAAQQCVDQLHSLWRAPPSRNGAGSIHATDASAALDVVEGQTIGRFQIECELGQGGAGIVLLATDPKLARRVALKVPRPESLISREMRQRFLREAEVAARLSHPHIVTVFEVGEDGPVCYIAAEYCAGPSLADWLAQNRELIAPRDAAALMIKLAAAIHHAHARGVLHRDLKPSNILLDAVRADDGPVAMASQELASFVPKVGDFGLAKLLEHEGDQTRAGTVMGTPRYMAPEQADGRVGDVGGHTDVYALGAILFELLSGAPPHCGASDADTLRRVLFDEPVPPCQARPELSRDLEAICLKCLEKFPERRYLTAGELEHDLRRYLAGEPTQARPLGIMARTWKWARRRPAIAALAAVTVGALLTIFIGTVVYSVLLQSALSDAMEQREVAQQAAYRSRQLLYAADIRRAHEAWKHNHVSEVLAILHTLEPNPDEEDLREFSWYYLHGLCCQHRFKLLGHQGDVFSVAWSPNGHHFASAGKDHTIRLWDLSAQEALQILTGHTGEVTCVAYSSNSEVLASASEDHTVRLWSAVDGSPIAMLAGHRDQVLSLAWSPDGRWLASGSRDNTARIWDASQGEQVARLEGDGWYFCAITFTRDSSLLLAGDGNGTLHCWKTNSWQPVDKVANQAPSSENLLALAHSLDRDWIAGGGRQNVIHLWRANDNGLRRLTDLDGGHFERIQTLAFSPRSPTLASGDKEGVIQLWDLDSQSIRRTILGHTSRIWSLAWSPDRELLASSGDDGAITFWNAPADSPAAAYPTLPQAIDKIELSPDGQTLIASTLHGLIASFDVASHALDGTTETGADGAPTVKISPDGLLVAARLPSGVTRISRRTDDQETIRLPFGKDIWMPLAWSPDGRQLAIALDSTTTVVVAVKTGQVERRLTSESQIYDLAFSTDGQRLAVAADRLRIWDLATGDQELNLAKASFARYTPDGHILAGFHSEAVLYDAVTGQQAHKFVGRSSSNVTISPDGQTLASSLESPDIILLRDARTSQDLISIELDGRVAALTFSQQGDRLLAAGVNKQGKGQIWEWTIRRDKH